MPRGVAWSERSPTETVRPIRWRSETPKWKLQLMTALSKTPSKKKTIGAAVRSRRTSKTVYILGAGFSQELGYPLTRQLLHLLPDGISPELKDIVRFHYPRWDQRTDTLPDIEELLTALNANEELLPTLAAGGQFNVETVRRTRVRLLRDIADWFHKIHESRSLRQKKLLEEFSEQHAHKADSIISFNWDYELDKALFDQQPGAQYYGIEHGAGNRPVLLKPHGSLNWYLESSVAHVKKDLLDCLYKGSGKEDDESVYRFLRWRAPKSKLGREYDPWIVPPTHLKRFRHPMLRKLWERSVQVLSTAKRVYFVGYSQPEADWHSRYILRCAFYNQTHGVPQQGTRRRLTSQAKVTVVNPDAEAFRRIEETVGWRCEWVPSTVATWLDVN